jgi:hypothetical protein
VKGHCLMVILALLSGIVPLDFIVAVQNSEVNNVRNVNHNPKGNYKIECLLF